MMTNDGLNSWLVWAPARWTADGKTQTGEVPAPSGSDAGRMVPVWLNRAGRVQAPPATAAQVGERASVAALTAMTALVIVLAGLALLTRRVLDGGGWRLGDGLAVGRPAVDPPALVLGPGQAG